MKWLYKFLIIYHSYLDKLDQLMTRKRGNKDYIKVSKKVVKK